MRVINHRELIIRLQNNDRQALDYLYKKLRHKLYLNVIKYTKNKFAAEDIVQDVFIRLWEKRQTLDPAQPIANWIFVVSYHMTMDLLKKENRISSLHEEGFLVSRNLSCVVEKRVKEKQFQLIEEAMESLSDQQKKVFSKCKMEGKTYKVTANELSISKYTVKEYLSIAMKKVRCFVATNKVAESIEHFDFHYTFTHGVNRRAI